VKDVAVAEVVATAEKAVAIKMATAVVAVASDLS
jgi:hypothetical protein